MTNPLLSRVRGVFGAENSLLKINKNLKKFCEIFRYVQSLFSIVRFSYLIYIYIHWDIPKDFRLITHK